MDSGVWSEFITGFRILWIQNSNISKNNVCSFTRAGAKNSFGVHTNFGKWIGISADTVLSVGWYSLYEYRRSSDGIANAKLLLFFWPQKKSNQKKTPGYVLILLWVVLEVGTVVTRSALMPVWERWTWVCAFGRLFIPYVIAMTWWGRWHLLFASDRSGYRPWA